MKKLPIFLLMLVLLPVLHAQSPVTFEWNPFASGQQPIGIEIRLTSTAVPPLAAITFDCGAAPTNICTVPAVAVGPWSAAAYCYSNGPSVRVYSDASNIVTFTIPSKPVPPTILKIISQVATVQGTSVLIESHTSLPSVVMVNYGLAGDKKHVDSWLNGQPTTSQQIILDNLRTHSQYAYKLTAWARGQRADIATGTFVTQ